MSNNNDENIITDIDDGKNIRRKADYNNKKPLLVCFNGSPFRFDLMMKWKDKDFNEKILKIRTSTRILFSKSSDEIFNYELIKGIYVEKTKYKSVSNNFIIELFLAILEQFGYKKELKILFADEKNPDKVDIKSIGHIIWKAPGKEGKEYIWDLYESEYKYQTLHTPYSIHNKLPEISIDNSEMTAVDYKDGEILDIHLQRQHIKNKDVSSNRIKELEEKGIADIKENSVEPNILVEAERHIKQMIENMAIYTEENKKFIQERIAMERIVEDREKSVEDREQKVTISEKSVEDREQKVTISEKSVEDREQKVTISEKSVEDREKNLKDREKSVEDREQKVIIADKREDATYQHNLKIMNDIRKNVDLPTQYKLSMLRYGIIGNRIDMEEIKKKLDAIGFPSEIEDFVAKQNRKKDS